MLDKNSKYEGDIVLSSFDGKAYMVGDTDNGKTSLMQVSEERMPDGRTEYYPTGKNMEVRKDVLDSRDFLLMETKRPEKGDIVKIDDLGDMNGYYKVSGMKDGKVMLDGLHSGTAANEKVYIENGHNIKLDYDHFRRNSERLVTHERRENIFEKMGKKMRETVIRLSNRSKGKDAPANKMKEAAVKRPRVEKTKDIAVKLPDSGENGAGRTSRDVAVKAPKAGSLDKVIAGATQKAAAHAAGIGIIKEATRDDR